MQRIVSYFALGMLAFLVAIAFTPVVFGAEAEGGAEGDARWCSDRYFGMQVQVGRPGTTHNDDKSETSDEARIGGGIFGGCQVKPWLAIEVHADAIDQRMHGCNKGQCGVPKSSVNGTQYLVPVTVGPAFKVPRAWGWLVEPYMALGVGPMVVHRDTTRSDPGGQRDDCHGCLKLGLRGEIGVERQVSEDVSARLGVGYLRDPAGEVEHKWIGLSMAYHF